MYLSGITIFIPCWHQFASFSVIVELLGQKMYIVAVENAFYFEKEQKEYFLQRPKRRNKFSFESIIPN